MILSPFGELFWHQTAMKKAETPTTPLEGPIVPAMGRKASSERLVLRNPHFSVVGHRRGHVLRSEIGAYFLQPVDHRHAHHHQGASFES